MDAGLATFSPTDVTLDITCYVRRYMSRLMRQYTWVCDRASTESFGLIPGFLTRRGGGSAHMGVRGCDPGYICRYVFNRISECVSTYVLTYSTS